MARRRRSVAIAVAVAALALVGRASAHGGSLGEGARRSITVPTWLFLTTGGAAVGASFLLASFVTDRSLIEAIHGWHRRVRVPARRIAVAAARAAGVAGLAAVLVVGFRGPPEATANLAVLLVWVGWWAGLSMSAYLLGNAWPVLNPWRTLARLLPTLDRSYPDRLGAWPSVAGLLGLVWLEVVSPLADDPPLLATTVAAYTAVTLVGATVFGPATWFRRVDPPARVFRYYGRVAPVAADDDGLRVRLPGTALSEARLVDGVDEVAFVVALLWVTTYDGLVTTPAWRDLLLPVVTAGVPSLAAYLAGMLVGYAVFLAAYWLAVYASRRTARTFVAAGELARRFAPPLLAIAAGYHLAHYLGYFLNLAPALAEAALTPFSAPAAVLVLDLPGWFGGVSLAAVLLGHLLAIWVAHATAYDLFAGRLQAVRSQYPFTAVMVFYTMVSLWIVSQPEVTVPYL
nr:hypothetical protein [Halomicrobium salinisoli]